MYRLFRIVAFILALLAFATILLEFFVAPKKSISFVISAVFCGVIFLFYALKKIK